MGTKNCTGMYQVHTSTNMVCTSMCKYKLSTYTFVPDHQCSAGAYPHLQTYSPSPQGGQVLNDATTGGAPSAMCLTVPGFSWDWTFSSAFPETGHYSMHPPGCCFAWYHRVEVAKGDVNRLQYVPQLANLKWLCLICFATIQPLAYILVYTCPYKVHTSTYTVLALLKKAGDLCHRKLVHCKYILVCTFQTTWSLSLQIQIFWICTYLAVHLCTNQVQTEFDLSSH